MIEAYWIAGCTASSVAEAAAQTLAKAGVKPEWIDEAHQVGVVMDLDSPAQKYHWPVVSPGDHRLVNLLVRSLAARECGLMLVGQTQEGQTALALLASAAAVGGRNILARARLMPLSGHRPPHDFFNHLPEALSEVEVESEQVAGWIHRNRHLPPPNGYSRNNREPFFGLTAWQRRYRARYSRQA